MKLGDLQKVLDIDRRRDRYVDELTKIESADLFLGGFHVGGKDRVNVQCSRENPLFGILRQCCKSAWQAEIARAEDELRALGVEI